MFELLMRLANSVPVATAGRAVLFMATTGVLSWKDEFGVVHSLEGIEGPRGAQGPQGAQGDAGPQGATGATYTAKNLTEDVNGLKLTAPAVTANNEIVTRQQGGAAALFAMSNGSGTTMFSLSGVAMYVGGYVGWTSSGFASSGGDVRLSRAAAGVVRVGTTANNNAGALEAARVRTVAATVATLPTAATAGAGARAFVTDANAATFGTALAGGGANAVPVWSNGTSWLIG